VQRPGEETFDDDRFAMVSAARCGVVHGLPGFPRDRDTPSHAHNCK
jgi:hypothetical protein